jgi:hypothetical protein
LNYDYTVFSQHPKQVLERSQGFAHDVVDMLMALLCGTSNECSGVVVDCRFDTPAPARSPAKGS